MRFTNSRTGRLLAAAGIVTIGVLGSAVAVMAVQDANSTDPEPVPTTEVTVPDPTTAPASAAPASAPVNTDAPATTAEPATTAAAAPEPTVVTLARGFENYRSGDALPAAPPAPTPEAPTVSTVPGPYGPIYPDGYATDEPQPGDSSVSTGTAPAYTDLSR